MSERKLATLERILDIKEHDNADALELATVRGWQVVVKKGEFKIGDLCVFFEIDSFLPCKEPFEFLRKNCYRKMADGTEGLRLKTVKLRGKVSQGLIIPYNEIFVSPRPARMTGVRYNNNILDLHDKEDVLEGHDVTDILEVTKYEPPMSSNLQGIARGNFPSIIRKTDSERVQNIWKSLQRNYAEMPFEVTLKLDGTSATYFWYNGRLGTCSRNLELHMDGYEDKGDSTSRGKDTYVSVGTRQGIYQALEKLGRNLAIQGEIIGEGIQKNPEMIQGQKLFIFDVFDIDQQRYLTPKERVGVLTEMAVIESHVPVLEEELYLTTFSDLDAVLSFAEGKSLRGEVREGVVFKGHSSERINFKAISNQFLLNEK